MTDDQDIWRELRGAAREQAATLDREVSDLVERLAGFPPPVTREAQGEPRGAGSDLAA